MRPFSYCAEQKIQRILVNVTDVDGLSGSRLPDRCDLGEKSVSVAARASKVVVVAQPGLIDREKFGVIVVAKRGFRAEVFSDESVVLEWMLAP